MKWPEIVSLIGVVAVILSVMVPMWSQLDTKIEARIGTLDTKFDTKFERIDAKFDTLNKLLTDNLLEMKGDIGELKGQARNPTP